MTHPTEKQIKAYMRSHAINHVDPNTDEICCTTLAEDTADEFNAVSSNGTIPELYFDLAFEIVTEVERSQKG